MYLGNTSINHLIRTGSIKNEKDSIKSFQYKFTYGSYRSSVYLGNLFKLWLISKHSEVLRHNQMINFFHSITGIIRLKKILFVSSLFSSC